MPRKARIKDDFGIFYISQHSSGTRHLFDCDTDRNKFIEILQKTQLKFHIKLYAYCIVSEDEYHLILDVNGGDLSKIMKSINIAYAMYVKCDSKLFKDRYKSILLTTSSELTDAITTIHKRYNSNSLYNSYCASNSSTPLPIELITSQLHTECIDCLRSLDEAKTKLQEIAELEQKTILQIFRDKNKRNQLIKDFRKHSTLSLKELGVLFGGLSESSICKILNQ